MTDWRETLNRLIDDAMHGQFGHGTTDDVATLFQCVDAALAEIGEAAVENARLHREIARLTAAHAQAQTIADDAHAEIARLVAELTKLQTEWDEDETWKENG